MGGVDMSDAAGGYVGERADRISSLPDHLLHTVLLRLPGTADAARTSVLSRRWRRIWTHLPDLVFDYSRETANSSRAHGRVDAALAAHAAETVNRFEITMPFGLRHLPVDCVSAWLLVASRRLAREIRISLPSRDAMDEEVKLPPCERVIYIFLDLHGRTLRFNLLPPASTFDALITLSLSSVLVDARELENILSSRCPRLKDLVLAGGTIQNGAPVVTFCSDSLERLEIHMRIDGKRLKVDAPKLQIFDPCISSDICIAAPNLAEVRWYNGDYDPRRHHLAEAGHHLQRLQINLNTPGSALMRTFHTVHELDMSICIEQGTQNYERFLQYIQNLAKCEVLVVRIEEIQHAFRSTMLHLFTKCAGVRKIVVKLSSIMGQSYDFFRDYVPPTPTTTHYSHLQRPATVTLTPVTNFTGFPHKDDNPCHISSECPCGWRESLKTQKKVTLGSLEEVEITGHGEADYKVELVRLLRNCRAAFQKKVVITISEDSRREYMIKKILSICPPSDKVEINVLVAT